jgi:hypothetical protein
MYVSSYSIEPFSKTLFRAAFLQVGFVALMDWLIHFVGLAAYTLAHKVLAPLVR